MEQQKFKIGIVIQARINSSRLPNKILKDFFRGKSILEIQIEKLLTLKLPIIVATTNNILDDEIVFFCKKNRIKYFRGDENNVLKRFVDLIKINNFKYILRVCSDNPFIDLNLIKTLTKFADLKNDYISYFLDDNTPVIKTHYGVFTELIKTDSLKNVLNTTNNEEDLEHVTKYIYENPTLFQIKYLKTPNYIQSNKNIRLTIDTQKDFELLSEIYSKTSNRKDDLKSTFDYINLNKTLKKEMVNNILRNQK